MSNCSQFDRQGQVRSVCLAAACAHPVPCMWYGGQCCSSSSCLQTHVPHMWQLHSYSMRVHVGRAPRFQSPRCGAAGQHACTQNLHACLCRTRVQQPPATCLRSLGRTTQCRPRTLGPRCGPAGQRAKRKGSDRAQFALRRRLWSACPTGASAPNSPNMKRLLHARLFHAGRQSPLAK